MKTNIHRRELFHRFAMSMSIALIIGTFGFLITDTHASNLERVCERGFIGYSYKPKLEKRCSALWTQWSNEIKQSFNQN